jgi:HSP20 family molecular chaperone IbpA
MCHPPKGHVHGPRAYSFMYDCHPGGSKTLAGIGKMAGHFMKQFMGQCGCAIPHNIEDLGDKYLITVPLPGRSKDEVKVSLVDKTLKIKAEKPKIPEQEGGEPKEKEHPPFHFPWFGFRFIEVDMAVPLPPDADENTIDSKMANGLLRITIQKKPAKNIDVKDNGGN